MLSKIVVRYIVQNNHVLRIDDKLYAKIVLVYSKKGTNVWLIIYIEEINLLLLLSYYYLVI